MVKYEIIRSNSKREPDISVLCATFNQDEYIEDAIKSFLMQDSQLCVEIIVHDDASTDGTVDRVRELQKRYPTKITAIIEEENVTQQGYKVFRDFLLPLSRGRYVALCEGDDFWIDANKLEAQFTAMELHPECGLCVCGVRGVKADGMIPTGAVFPSSHFDTGLLDSKTLIQEIISNGRYLFQTSSYFMRRSSLLDNEKLCRKAHDMFQYGDEGIIRFFLAESKILYIDRIMSCYRQNAKNSWTSRLSGKHAIDRQCNRLISVNTLFNEYTSETYADFVQQGNDRACIIKGIADDECRTTYRRYHRTKAFQSLPLHLRMNLTISNIFPRFNKWYQAQKAYVKRCLSK